MSNKTKKQNKVVKEAEVIEEEVVETAETIEAAVEDAKNEATENAEVETESNDSGAVVEVETKKVFKPIAKVKDINWKKAAADALKVAVGFGAGYVVGKKVMSGGEQHPSENETEVIDAEFVEKNDDVDVTTEE